MSASHGTVVTISPVRCAVLGLFGLGPHVPRGALARWVGTPAYGQLEVLLPHGVETAVGG